MDDAQRVAEDIACRLSFRDSWPDDDAYAWAVSIMAEKIRTLVEGERAYNDVRRWLESIDLKIARAALATARGAGSEDD